MGRKFITSKEAVSTVLGFVIIMAIVLSVTSVFVASQIPEWTKEFEAEHASKVPHDFAELSSVVDRAILSEDPSISSSCTIGMVPKSVPVVGMQSSGGVLRFDPNSETFECIASTPGEAGGVSGNFSWNSSSDDPIYNFSSYDKFHVTSSPSGARLELEKEEDKVFDSGTVEYLSGEYDCDKFVVTNNTELKIKGGMLEIHAKNIIIDAGSEINATGEGWPGGAAESNGTGDGAGRGGDEEGSGGGGAGYGANGGDGEYNPGSGGSSYGNATSPTAMMGSGGGGGGNGWSLWNNGVIFGTGGQGGDGGGYVWLEASTINISGTISANGTDGEQGASLGLGFLDGGGGGGGSGGCILIKGDAVNISNTGMLYATGGNGGTSGGDDSGDGGGGAGGRIKVFYDSHDPGDISDFASVSGENDGTVNKTHLSFTTTIPHYSTGHLVSNVSSVKGHIGYGVNATQVCYDNITWDETVPAGTNIVMKVRTSMDANMTDAMPWEDCPEVIKGQDISDLSSVSNGHRYIQWRADFITFMPSRTPVLHSVNISYECGTTPALVKSSGIIEFDSQYLYLPNYRLIHTHGATLKSQREDEFVLHNPPIYISNDINGISLKITAINLTGSEDSIAGVFSGTVKASYQNSELVTGGLNFYNISINFTTEHRSAWQDWFNDTCKGAGLEYGSDPGNYNLTGNGDTMRVTFYGNESRPVNLRLKSAEAEITILK